MKRLIASLALIVGLLALLAACGGGAPPQPPYTPGKISGMLVYPGGSTPDPSLTRTGEPMAFSGIEIGALEGSAAGNDLGANRPVEVVPGEVIVIYEDGLRSQSVATDSLATLELSISAVGPVAAGQNSAQLYRAEGLDQVATVALATRISSLPGVAAAFPNWILHAFKTPNDPVYPAQWHYSAMNLSAAWDIEDGTSATVTVAVVDSGAIPHPDLQPNLLPGYDFITDAANAGDGDGRDSDPTDMGGSPQFHGSHVAGTIAAATNNGGGVAGVSWGAKVVPVRVLGISEGGTFVDILDGIFWAAGGSVEGVPNNPNPARVINMSLGGNIGDVCPANLDQLFGQLTAAGVILVAAAGNDNIDAEHTFPANCSNMITVGATGPTNTRAPYSNYGAAIDVMAAGGDTNMSYTVDGNTYPAGVLSTAYDPTAGQFAFTFMQGTSMASPHIAGIAALMLARDPGLTFADVKARLQMAATPLDAARCVRPTGQDCGAGLVDAAKALIAGGGPTPGPGPTPTEPPPPPPPPPTQSPITYIAALYCIPGSDCTDFDYSRSQETAIEVTSNLVPYELAGLEPGTYVAAAWQDLNGDGEIDDNEPFGVYGDIGDVRTWQIRIDPWQHRQNVMIVMQPASYYSASQLSANSDERADLAAALARLVRQP